MHMAISFCFDIFLSLGIWLTLVSIHGSFNRATIGCMLVHSVCCTASYTIMAACNGAHIEVPEGASGASPFLFVVSHGGWNAHGLAFVGTAVITCYFMSFAATIYIVIANAMQLPLQLTWGTVLRPARLAPLVAIILCVAPLVLTRMEDGIQYARLINTVAEGMIYGLFPYLTLAGSFSAVNEEELKRRIDYAAQARSQAAEARIQATEARVEASDAIAEARSKLLRWGALQF
jgi:hypothetical protein